MTEDERVAFITTAANSVSAYKNQIAKCLIYAQPTLLDKITTPTFLTIYNGLNSSGIVEYFNVNEATTVMQALFLLFQQKYRPEDGAPYIYVTKARVTSPITMPSYFSIIHKPKIVGAKISLEAVCDIGSSPVNANQCIPYQTREVDIFAPLNVYYFHSSPKGYLPPEFENQAVLMPALFFLWMESSNNSQQDVKQFFTALNALSCVTGAGMIVNGVRAGKILKILAGMAELTPAFSELSKDLASPIIKSTFGVSGEKFVEEWEKVNSYLAVAGFGVSNTLLIRDIGNMAKAYKALKTTAQGQANGMNVLKSAFKTAIDADQFDALMLKLSQSNSVTLGISDSKSIAKTLSQADITKLKTYNLTRVASDGCTDIIVHFTNGKYEALFEQTNKLVSKTFDTKDLAALINDPSLQSQIIFRLVSCSNLEAGKELSKLCPTKIIYATEDIVCLHADGGITTIARSGNATQKWRKLMMKNGVLNVTDAPDPIEPQTGTTAVENFVEMGISPTKDASKTTFLEETEEFEYFYRAMSKDEFDKNNGLIYSKCDENKEWSGEPNYTTTNIDYLIHPGPGKDGCTEDICKGLLRRSSDANKYQIVVKYRVTKGTINSLNKTKSGPTPSSSKLLKKRWVVAKKEGSKFILPGGTITYGFYADIADDDFHRNIIEISYIKKELLL